MQQVFQKASRDWMPTIILAPKTEPKRQKRNRFRTYNYLDQIWYEKNCFEALFSSKAWKIRRSRGEQLKIVS